MRLRSIFLRNRFWTSAIQRRGRRGHGWVCGSGSRRELIWRGLDIRRRRRQKRTKTGWKIKGEGEIEDPRSWVNGSGYNVA